MLQTIRFTTDEYTRLAGLLGDRRTELIDGQIVLMPAIGTAHLVVTTRLQRMLTDLNAQGRLLVQQPLRIPAYDEPEPDLQVLRRPLELRKPGPSDLALLIEVSDTTYTTDRYTKLPRYLGAGVPLVWIVNISDHACPQLEAYTSMVEAEYVRSSGVAELLDEGVIDLDVLFDGVEQLPADEYPRA